MNPVLAADSVGKRFGIRRILTAASVRARAGRITAILGRNGCGKTTLLRILVGFVRADHGLITFRGRHWPRPALHRMAADGLFYVPERDLLSRGRTVGEHVDDLVRRYPGPAAGADSVIAAHELAGLLDRPPERLSGGERRRAEIGLALIRRPACLIADEPFMGIAPRDIEAVAAALRALATLGAAILVTGHEVQQLLGTADEIVWLTAGTTHLLGSPDEARARDSFRREYLGPGRSGTGRAPPRSVPPP